MPSEGRRISRGPGANATYSSCSGRRIPYTSRSVVTASVAIAANGAGAAQSRKWLDVPTGRSASSSASSKASIAARLTVGADHPSAARRVICCASSACLGRSQTFDTASAWTPSGPSAASSTK